MLWLKVLYGLWLGARCLWIRLWCHHEWFWKYKGVCGDREWDEIVCLHCGKTIKV